MPLAYKDTEVIARAASSDLATRVATPLPVAEVLSDAGREATRAAGRHDAARRLATLPPPLPHVDPLRDKPDLRLLLRMGHRAALRHGLLPWRRQGGETIVLTSRPERFHQHLDMLRVLFGPIRMGRVDEATLQACLARHCTSGLMRDSEERTPVVHSCRTWNAPRARRIGLAILAIVGALALVWPAMTMAVLAGWAVLTLGLTMALKLAAAILHLRARRRAARHPAPPLPEPLHLPTISILVPLLREKDIADHLVAHLQRLDYPADRLDICLILEEDDVTTSATLSRTALPPTMRVITVPVGALRTKPRALNYALSFTHGSIIGVYDAEDAPEPDQLRIVARHFAAADPQVACLQGRLEFYNAGTNWLSRCFAIEYAAWFRIMLPGLARLGLPVPLGGTTLFFRRDVLERIGGWDAHNVTEDADLGIRLARHGYRTDLIPTTTGEEANCRAWPWIKQRSRWIKGYALTYAVHMRNPAQLWRDLGGWGFFGVQLIFLASLSQFLLAPLLWSFWLVAFGLPHPLTGLLPGWMFWTLGGVFLASELLGLWVSWLALRETGRTWLAKWAPTLHVYFPLGALAAWKGIIELGGKPFYWDKTAHGIFPATGTG
ncbi:MAG: glycosyltransferase [Rhodobacteraceae bacterium HLUCCA08]|nr:MAG: glycosyltransferase [Rhodobacteraceae bacterium HLUCCA08]